MAENSILGIVEIVLRIICATLGLGVLIASVITITTINDIDLFDDDSIPAIGADEDTDRYRAVAGWLIFVGIASIIIQIIFSIVRGLYYGEVIISQFAIFGVVSLIFTILLALALIAGGGASAAQAVDVQNDYIDTLWCDEPSVNSISRDLHEEFCDDFERIRNTQAAAAGLSFLGTVMCVVTAVLVCVEIAIKRDS